MGVPLYQAKAELFKTLGHPARIRILELLSDRDHAVHELLEQIEIEPSNLSQQLAVLRRSSMVVSRRRSETDRRNNGLWLTPAGEAALARLRTVAEEHQADVLSPLDDAERAALAGLLQKLSDGSALPRDGHPGYGR